MSARPASSGKGTTTLRDNRPGLVRAGSNTCITANMTMKPAVTMIVIQRAVKPHQARALPTLLGNCPGLARPRI